MSDAVGGTVTKQISEKELDTGLVTLGAREVEVLGLPAHSGEVACRHDDEEFAAVWNARESTLGGEVLHERLMLYGRVGSLLRLQPTSGGIEVDITTPATTTLTADRRPWSPPPRPVTPSLSRAAAPRRERKRREERFRIRDASEYEWHGDVGIHRPSVERLRRRIDAADWDPPHLFDLRLRGELLASVNDFDELLAVDLAKVDHMPHQERTAAKALGPMRGRAILADEVGLGKTIEAGLVMKELVVRGLARRILVICPATLREQWREELRDKFDEHFDVVVSRYSSLACDRLIVSHHLARQNVDELAARDWDLVIVDEAHKLTGPQARASHRLLRALDSRFKLFLTATPVQNDLLELYRLVELLRPGTFRSEREFRQRYVDRDNKRLPRDPQALRRLVSDVMIRTTREQAGLDKVKRHAVDIPVTLSRPERQAYELCTDLLRRVMTSPHDALRRRNLAQRLTASPRALATTARKLARSHENPRAVEILDELADLCQDFGLTNRQRELLRLVERWTADRAEHGKVLVFSQAYETVHDLLRILDEAGVEAVAYHGGLTPRKRQEAISRFRGDAPVMVSTDAGAEGLNLQFANCVVNYDLPWNPMRIEQRIGRVHRVTQHRDVYVANLFALGTIDEHVYRLLHDKLRMFELLFGQVTTILGELGDSRDEGTFEHQVLEAYLAPTDEEMERRLEELGRKVDAAYRSAQEVVASDAHISSWLADLSHREQIVGEATELVPDVELRARDRQREVLRFTRELLDALGAEVEIATEDDSFLLATLPDDAPEALGGRRQLCLAFSPEGLDHHRDAELCAVGSEVFDELLGALEDRGEVLVEVPPVPELDPGPLVPASPDTTFVGRELQGPRSWAATVHWRVTTGESSVGGQILPVEVGKVDELASPQHRALGAGEPIPTTAGQRERLTGWLLDESVPRLKATLAAMQKDVDAHAAAERDRLVASYEQQIAELRERQRHGRASSREVSAEIAKLRRARDAVRKQRTAPLQLRSEPLSARLVGDRTLRFVERWRAATGAEGAVVVEWDPWGDEPPRATGADGKPVRRVRVCSSGHAVDAEATNGCATCDHVGCALCDPAHALQPCVVCAAAVCPSCRNEAGACRACTQPARAPEHDADGMVAWRLGNGRRLLVGERVALLDDELIDATPPADEPWRARARAEARRRGLRLDMGVRAVAPDRPVDVPPAAFALRVTTEPSWTVEPTGGAAVQPDAAEHLPEAAVGDVTWQGASPLDAVIDRLRREVPPSPAPCLVADTVRRATWLEPRDGELHVVTAVDSGLRPDPVVTSSPLALSRDDGDAADVVATAPTPLGLVTLRRLHRSYVIEVEGGGTWFVPADHATDQVVELVASRLAAEADVLPGTAVGLGPVVPLPEGVASPPGARCVHVAVEQRWERAKAAAARPLAADDLSLVALGADRVHEVAPAAATADLRQLARRLDGGRDDRTIVALQRSVTVEATWEGRRTVTRRFPAVGAGLACPPLDDTGSPAEEFTIDDHGHLCEPAHSWRCPACETWRCRACGDDGVLGPCPTCGQAACGSCRAADHEAPPPAACARCGATSCGDCGRDIHADACAVCRRTVCASCRTGSRCRTCADLAPATDEDVAGLPDVLVAHGADVLIARDDRAAIVAISATARRELAVVEGDTVTAWWTADDTGEAEARLRLAAGAQARCGHVDIRWRPLDEAPLHDGPGMVVRRSLAVEVDWALHDAEGQVCATAPAPSRAESSLPADLIDAVAGSLGNVPIPAPPVDVPHRRALLHAVPQASGGRRGAAVELRPRLRVDEHVVVAEGLLRRTGTVADIRQELLPWAEGPGPFAGEIGDWPVAPLGVAHAATDVVGAVIGRIAGTVVVGVRADGLDGPTDWYGFRPAGEAAAPLDPWRLAIRLGRRAPCEVVRLTLPGEVTPFTVAGATLRQRAVRPHVDATRGRDGRGLTAAAAAFWARDTDLAAVVPTEGRSLPADLGRQLEARIPQAGYPDAISLGVEHHEVWQTRDNALLQVTYVVRGGARLGLVAAHDTGMLCSTLTADRSGHLVETTTECPYCGALTCARCDDAVAPCWLCASPVCGQCARPAPDRPACPACASLERLGWWERRRHEVAGALLQGADDRHQVVVAPALLGARVTSTTDGTSTTTEVPLSPEQATYLSSLARRRAFRPGPS